MSRRRAERDYRATGQQLSLTEAPRDAIVGRSWEHPEHGRCTVVAVVGDTARVDVAGPRKFEMLWPVALAARELSAARTRTTAVADEWVSDGDGSFFNASENSRLAALGLVPLAEPATDAVPARRQSESRQEAATQTEGVMTVATRKKPAKAKKSAIAGLSKAKLRAYLLEHQTVPDKAWNAAYGAPAREKGETREHYVKRVLA